MSRLVQKEDPTPVRILQPGRNCWRIGRAERVAVLVDAADYYAALDASMRAARRSIQIVGWDFDGRICLRPDDRNCTPLGPFLRELAERRPELEIRILVWSFAVVHAPGAPVPLLLGAAWQDHPRITVKLDREHPFYACHHQKIVTIDDTIAFSGGIDLTVQRWDTALHQQHNGYRSDPDGIAYAPVHDVQMAVDGAPARDLSELVRERWRRATGETLAAVSGPPGESPWPENCTPDFCNVNVAVARTIPPWRDADGVEEIAALTEDLLLAAREKIYIEAQYFCGRDLRKFMSQVLKKPAGPEVIVITGRDDKGVVEKAVMGRNRARLMRRLRRADTRGRLKMYSPAVDGPKGVCDVMVHAKVMIVDDDYLRVGSANLNNRSMGLDTECDLVIEARDERARWGIAEFRHRLLAEHLGATVADVRSSIQRHGLITGADRLNIGRRGLRPFPSESNDGPEHSVFGTAILDPRRPLVPAWFRRWTRNGESVSVASAAETRTLPAAASQERAGPDSMSGEKS